MITIGADPEIFLKKNNAFISADGIIKGSKDDPYYFGNGTEAVQLDGVAAEFNTRTCSSANSFVQSIGNAVRYIEHEAKQHGATVAIEPVADFTTEYFASLRPATKELGCNPDFDAWACDMNPMPEGDRPYRTGSGHVHVGIVYIDGEYKRWDLSNNDDFYLAADYVRQLDYALGVPSLLWDRDNRRRTLYGKAGAFRPKTYGFEYRVLSNAWLKSDSLITWIFDTTKKAIEDFQAGRKYEDMFGELAVQIINGNECDWPEKYPELLKEINIKGL